MSNQNYLSYIHSYKYNEVTTEPKWKKKDRLSYKNGPHATVYMMNGDTYFGEWKDNLKHGHGTYNYYKTKRVYDGEWAFDKRNGEGMLSIREDDPLYDPKLNEPKDDIKKKNIMDGYYDILKHGIQDEMESKSINNLNPKNLKNNSKMKYRKLYVGQWMDDKFNGYGTYYYNDGIKEYYEGYWENGMNEGWGVMHYKDGSYYEGEWHKKLRHGKGLLMLKNGDCYEGMWMNGEKEGPGKFIYKSKRQMYEGQWSNGIPKCGTIVDISELPIYPKRKYPIPPCELKNPDRVLQKEYKELTLARLKKIYGDDFDYKEYIYNDDDIINNDNEQNIEEQSKDKYVVNSLKNLYINVLVESNQENSSSAI